MLSGTDPGKVKWPKPKHLILSTNRQAYERRKDDLRTERSEYLEEMKDIAAHAHTMRGRFLLGDNRKKRRTINSLLHEKMIFASRTCGAGMLAGVSSPSRPWLKLGTPDKALNEFASVKRWLDHVEKKIYQVFSVSNYYHSKQSSYRDMGDFGQGPVILDEDYEDVLNCYCSPPGEYYLSVDQKGRVNTIVRDMRRSTMQLVEQFYHSGNIPRQVQEAYDRSDYDRQWDIVHFVQPNIQMAKGMRGPLGMPFSSVYYCLGVDDNDNNATLQVSGYRENPISAPRWDVQPGDVYGSDHPGAIALPGTKSLQVLEKRKGQMIDKMSVPPLQAPAGMEQGKVISHMPGNVSYYPANQGPGTNGPITPLYRVEPAALQYTGAEGKELEQRIDVAYFVDLFLATINSDRRQVTAREISEVHEEKLIALGPVLERTHYEGLNIEYTSLLAVAQRAIGATGIERFSGFLGNLAAGNPEVLDKWDMDQTVDEYADVTGVPASMVRSDEEVAKLREARQAQQQQQQALAAAVPAAETAKVLSEADTGRNSNLLADIIGGQGRLV
jgi:hypothetical protein